MASGLFSSSRTTLFFAGGVIVCVAIAASSLSTDFAPKANGADGEVMVEASASSESDALAAERRAEAQQSGQNEESVFGDYEAVADEELIDDTAGFDPTPADDETWTITSETSQRQVSEMINPLPISEGRLTPVTRQLGGDKASGAGSNPLQRTATPEDAKRQAAQLKKLRERKQ